MTIAEQITRAKQDVKYTKKQHPPQLVSVEKYNTVFYLFEN